MAQRGHAFATTLCAVGTLKSTHNATSGKVVFLCSVIDEY